MLFYQTKILCLGVQNVIHNLKYRLIIKRYLEEGDHEFRLWK